MAAASPLTSNFTITWPTLAELSIKDLVCLRFVVEIGIPLRDDLHGAGRSDAETIRAELRRRELGGGR